MNNQLPAHLQNRQRRNIADNVHEGLGAAAPPYVSIKGGAFTLVDQDGKNIPIATNYLDCIIIDAAAHPSRVYWGNRSFDPNAESYQAPECFSDNGIGASVNASNPQSASCQTCPQNVWGSATSKVSGKAVKACGVIKKVAVLAYLSGDKDTDGIYAGTIAAKGGPFLLRVPVMSHDNLRAYSDQFRNQDFDVSDVVTRITFVHGAVGVLDFMPFAFADETINGNVDKILESGVTDRLVGRDDQPIAALAKPATAEPVGKPKLVDQAPPAEPMQIAPAATAKAGRGRPRKSAAAGETATGPFAASQQPRTAPFVQQSPHAGHGIAQQLMPQLNHGIVTNAGNPPESVEKSLDTLFNLKTR